MERALGLKRSVQRKLYLFQMLEALSMEPQTVNDLAIKTDISRPAAESVIGDLEQLGWVTREAPLPGIGRPAVRWRMSSKALFVVGLHIDTTQVVAVVADCWGKILSQVRLDLDPDMESDIRINRSAEAATQALRAAKITADQISLCSVAAPGIIDDGVVANFFGKAMPGWPGLEIKKILSEKLGIPVLVSRDFALGAFGEVWGGAAGGHKDVIYIRCDSNRLGAAIIVDGRPYTGFGGAAGIIELLPQLRWAEYEKHQLEKYVFGFSSALDADSSYPSDFDELTEMLALGAAGLILALGPSLVVLSGNSEVFSELGITRFREIISRRCPIAPEVVFSPLGTQAIILGAVQLALTTIWEELQSGIHEVKPFPQVRFRPTLAQRTGESPWV